MKDLLFILFQYLAPTHLISRMAGWLASNKTPWLKSLLIEKFIARFKVNMEEAENSDPGHYASFNEFFCRPLKPGVRPMALSSKNILSPADGAFSQLGNITAGRIFQAKGFDFSADELLGGQEPMAEAFKEGQFATIYLSPKDYHRLHMPIGGCLRSMVHIPGSLFSVNPVTTDHVSRLFARNERVACIFETEAGPMAMVLVGAMVVASIETVWSGVVAPRKQRPLRWNYPKSGDDESIILSQGDEMGRFLLGSTVVLLFPKGAMQWSESFRAGLPVQMGETIGHVVD